MTVRPAAGVRFDLEVPVAIVGAGACGLTAALAAREAGVEVLLLERDDSPSGSTSLSSGFIPAAPTRWQQAKGVADSAAALAADIQRKARGQTRPEMARQVAALSGPALEWLADSHGLEFELLEGFVYPGHSALRMHAVPERSGAALLARLLGAATRAGADLATGARVVDLFADESGRLRGLELARSDGRRERLGCDALVLACNGFGGDREMVRQYIPEMAEAWYFGHPGNQGEALRWGRALGAAVEQMGAYQGHGSVATPHGILITWAIMMQGGIQVNLAGRRFSDEQQGYSEQAVAVLAQPDGVAWNLYDRRLHELAMGFEDYRAAEAAGALRSAASLAELARATALPAEALAETLEACAALAEGRGRDPFGRDFTQQPPLAPPYHAVKVTGALFHTQGGLRVDEAARVLRPDGTPLPNLFAGGGAACGVSGPAAWGYLSGNGLLTAVTLGRLAGAGAARLAAG